jgi:hypothetical protein
MTINLSAQRVNSTVPAAFVTKGRQRVKQFNDQVYLRNGDEFEIELFNPTQNKVLAKISLNGKSLGSGIVLRPAERVFLERYFDEARKFLFETYAVEANDEQAKKAIALNGLVEVEFFDEYKNQPIYHNTVTYNWNQYPWSYTSNGGFIGSSLTSGHSGAHVKGMSSGTRSKGVADSFGAHTFLCSCKVDHSDEMLFEDSPSMSLDMRKEMETGRVEKGGNSDQSFSYDSTQFQTYRSWVSSWKIMPESQKPIFQEDLRVFCTKCGKRRRKSSDVFCSKCGTKF